MTSQGSAHGRLARAVERANVEQVEMAARELGKLSLLDALSVLYARTGSPKFEQAAVRWLSRLGLEGGEMRARGLDVKFAGRHSGWRDKKHC